MSTPAFVGIGTLVAKSPSSTPWVLPLLVVVVVAVLLLVGVRRSRDRKMKSDSGVRVIGSRSLSSCSACGSFFPKDTLACPECGEPNSEKLVSS